MSGITVGPTSVDKLYDDKLLAEKVATNWTKKHKQTFLVVEFNGKWKVMTEAQVQASLTAVEAAQVEVIMSDTESDIKDQIADISGPTPAPKVKVKVKTASPDAANALEMVKVRLRNAYCSKGYVYTREAIEGSTRWFACSSLNGWSEFSENGKSGVDIVCTRKTLVSRGLVELAKTAVPYQAV